MCLEECGELLRLPRRIVIWAQRACVGSSSTPEALVFETGKSFESSGAREKNIKSGVNIQECTCICMQYNNNNENGIWDMISKCMTTMIGYSHMNTLDGIFHLSHRMHSSSVIVFLFIFPICDGIPTWNTHSTPRAGVSR